MVGQREDLETSVGDMNEETESNNRTFLDDSDSTKARLTRGELVKGVFVPKFAAHTVHGPRGNTMQAIETVTGCVDVITQIKSGTKTHNLTIHAKEGDAGQIRWAENIMSVYS